MKIVCSQVDLKNNLSLVSRSVPSRPTHPILSNVLLVADKAKNCVTLTGFDLSLGIRSSFSAEVEESGMITLPSKFLNDIISRLPDGEVSLSYDEEDLEDNPLVAIDSLSGKFQLRGVSGDEFPELPTIEKKESFLLPISALIEGLKGTLFSASTDETKQVLTGVHLTRHLNILEFAATDGHRLAVVKTTEESSDEDTETGVSDEQNFSLTIPSRALRELEKMLSSGKENEAVALYVDNGQLVFELGNQHLTSRKLEGGYPNYNQLIPTKFERKMIVDRKRVIEGLERVSVFADQKNNLVKFKLDPDNNQVILSVEAKELGNAKESFSVEIYGDGAFEIGFNIKYLMEGLKALSANEITFHFNGATQPVILTPLSGLQMTYLIMPVQIRD
ncbi:DNA polymerase III subunit beta [Geminocystis sp. GBBB08]|uniref:DNA polymerase III subunit beta n=1 Tax=Geminocystis sp. GBBB08 TaxID=2604140 RepID=UPI0027E31AA6|nr:DNA polymerase III subunit beta [Geminocystis sp. GBBB08]MBL1208762.1 DNA polymerase III subunit beta [Geminocystis sp. GBBB08]